jgi:hypothetical protein
MSELEFDKSMLRRDNAFASPVLGKRACDRRFDATGFSQ